MKSSDYLKIILGIAGNGRVYLVGGAVRDLLSGRPSSDFDFAMSANPSRMAAKFSRAAVASVVVLDEERKIYRVVKKTSSGPLTFDFSAYRGPTIERDLMLRDITVNAMALPLKSAAALLDETSDAEKKIATALLDPSGGLDDFKKRRIKLVREKAAREDPARLLRVFRFAAELGFAVEPKTLASCRRLRGKILEPAPERLRDEIFKIFATDRALSSVKMLDKTGILEILAPEITALKKSCKSFYFHPQGLWHHLTETLGRVEEYASDVPSQFPEAAGDIGRYLSRQMSSGNVKSLLKFVTLLHDAGKPLCAKRIAKRMRFFGHETVGIKVFNDIAVRLKFSRDEMKFAATLIKNHMRILQLVGSGNTSDRAVYRLRRDAGDTFPALCLLSLSDAASYRNLKGFEKNNVSVVHDFVSKALKNYFDDMKKPPRSKIIDGHMIMRRLSIKPGPAVGVILKRLEEERAVGTVKTTAEALECARGIYREISTGASPEKRRHK
jgi:tRNA nucleotidyltransferase/poly(A) polymerase